MAREIGVVGTFIRDTIVTLDGRSVESIGGLYHTLAYLACLVAPGTIIRPLCHVGADFHDQVRAALAAYGAHVRLDLLRVVPQSNTAVRLVYRSAETRDEITTAPMPALTAPALQALARCDAVLVNLITGRDVELEALQSLKQRSSAPLVYLDLHSLALGIDALGRRYYRALPEGLQWMRAADVLQVNEMEAATLAGLPGQPAESDLVAWGTGVVASSLQACHITLASRGSLLFHRRHGRVQHQRFDAAAHLQALDIIGCGDAFGAAFLASYLEWGDIVAATQFANTVAGLNCTFLGSLTLEKYRAHVSPHLNAGKHDRLPDRHPE